MWISQRGSFYCLFVFILNKKIEKYHDHVIFKGVFVTVKLFTGFNTHHILPLKNVVISVK
ncbi:TPA: hypothetical protein DCG86_07135 [Candidatus Marinimicrobia bacterium]|nr:hypothetical protein [Candidatus Neomarinimicrobiota bacterium]HBY17594.1 hypothetical protein [Candidatus Neomarinimicrobiota bacterium]